MGSIADLNISIYGPDSEDEQSAGVSHDVTDELDINLNSLVNSVPLIDLGNYENVPSTLSAIASFPATPVTPAFPITPDSVTKKEYT